MTLVDQHNYTQFQPLLYQVATAQVGLDGVARPLRGIFRKYKTVNVKMGVVSSVDAAAKTVTCADGTTFGGDYLVLAAGSQPNFFHTPGADTHAFPLYALVDAERLRSRVFEVFEDADRNPKLLDRGALNFVIVGAGATGVETAGALADLINDVMPSRFHDLSLTAARIHVVDPADVVLAPFSEQGSRVRQKGPRGEGREARARRAGHRDRPDRVVLSDDREILTRTVIWAGGIQAAAVSANTGIPAGHGGRIDVQPDLTVEGFPDVYALGDMANTPGPDGKPFPQLGSVALQAGHSVGPEHPRRHRRKADLAVPLPRQGDHGDDRPERGDRRGRSPPARAPRRHRLRLVARRPRRPSLGRP